MAIQLVSAIKRYIGTAAEVAAFPLAGLPVGSTFFESDTGILKVLNAAGALVQAPGETVALSGSKLVEQKTEADAVANVITFTDNINAIEIFHENIVWQSFTVNGLVLQVPSGGYRTPIGGTPATTVTIPAGLDCIVGRLI